MIKEIERNSNTPNWNEVITLELTLRDLQIIFDAVGAMPPRALEEKHELYNSSLFNAGMLTYDVSSLIDDVYDELRKILTAYNGIID